MSAPLPGDRRLIAARRWTPPRRAAGPVSRPLANPRTVAIGGQGPEDVQFTADGQVVAGLADGCVIRLDPETGTRSVIANTGGRPLGVDVCADGSVLVCDHDRGLLRVRDDGSVEVLVEEVDRVRLRFASNVAHRDDGTIWFTTSSARWDLAHHEGDLFEHSCTGVLVQRDPDGTVRVLRRGLAFGNGLVLAADGSHLLYAETAAYRISRYWLTGPRADTSDVLVDGLPGFPDNMSRGSDGLLWVAYAAPRLPVLDALLPLPGVLRQLVWALPAALRPPPQRVTWVAAVDDDGRIVHDLRSEDLDVWFVTSVTERDGVLVLGSLHGGAVLVADRPA